MIDIKYDDKALLDKLNRVSELTNNLRPALQDIGEQLIISTKARFRNSVAPDGSKWAPNAESTLLAMLRKRGGLSKKRSGSKPMATKKGLAMKAQKKPLIGESKRLGNEIFHEVSGNTLRIGSALEYAAVQQFGAKKGEFGKDKRSHPLPWGDIPARPFLGISEQDRRDIIDILEEHLEAALR